MTDQELTPGTTTDARVHADKYHEMLALADLFDKAGTEMMDGGGTLLVEGGTRWKGPGHNAVVFSGTKAYNLYHSYDANANGQSILRIAELVWDAEGWPISAGP